MSSFDKILREVFGFQHFRKGQREALDALFAHSRVLCIQPTGHGKSLLYQLPAYLLEGITLVVSPLLALMRDQIEHLSSRFKISAASINSDQTEEENGLARMAALEGKIRILFISPEQLDHIDRFEFLSKLNVSLFVVDEAHCISTWGHDFRPGYRQILHFIESQPASLKVLALTATADARVEEDLKRQLSTTKTPLHILREEMDRPNIHLTMLQANSIAEKLLLCQMLLADLEGSGLIYTATRENAELVAEFLKNQNIKAIAYHAGLDSDEKRQIQRSFVQDHYKVVAATTALGMGIDKGNLRFILHFDIPGSITSYYQEIGRCGRDGKKAEAILLYHPPDKKIQEYFIDASLPSSENFELIFEAVKTAQESPNLTAIKRATGLHPTRVTIVLAELIEQQLLKKESVKGSQVYTCAAEYLSLDLSRYTNQHQVKTEELQKMLKYAEEKGACRMALLRAALGDISPLPCGRCDNCLNAHDIPELSSSRLSLIKQWLQEKPVPIASTRTYRIEEGYSVLDGKVHSELFIYFMKQRVHSDEIEENLWDLLKKQAELLAKQHLIQAIVPLPSRTWKAREKVAQMLAEALEVPVLHDLLEWSTAPEKRQGELLNNDQRSANVHEQMKAKDQSLPKGALLLLDDYIGSGATMKEAARAIRTSGKEGKSAILVPLTVAAIKWRLGKPGFI